MTVQNLIVKNIASGNGSTTQWPFTFACPVDHPEYIKVYIKGASGEATATTDFSVNMTTKYVTYPVTGSVLASGEKIIIARELPLHQILNLVNQGPFYAEDLEVTYDELVMMIQQLNEQLGRSLKVGVDIDSDSDIDVTIPVPTDNDVHSLVLDKNGFKLFSNPGDAAEYAATAQNAASVAEAKATIATNAVASLPSNWQDIVKKTGGWVTPQMYGAKADGVTDDTNAIQQALDSGVNNIFFPKGDYYITSSLRVDTDRLGHFYIQGTGQGSKVFTDRDIVLFDFFTASTTSNNGKRIFMEKLVIANTGTNRTNYGVKCDFLLVPYFKNVYFTNNSNGGLFGLYIINAVAPQIEGCVFNHSSIKLHCWDAKIDKCYIWALSQDFGIFIENGSGNITVTNTDIVPPFQSNSNYVSHSNMLTNWDTAKLQAAIVVGGGTGNTVNNVKLTNIYIDGNPQLTTGRGIIINKCFNVLIDDWSANQTNDDLVIIDSSTCVTVSRGQIYNCFGNDCCLIQGIKTGSQGLEDIIISDNVVKLTDTTQVSTPLRSCIEFLTSLVRSTITNNRLTSSNGRMYTYGIKVNYSTDLMLYTNRASYEEYYCRLSKTIASGSSGATFNYGTKMPYTPVLSCYNIQSDKVITYRIQQVNANQIWLALGAATTADTTIDVEVKL